ncbi:MAG: hypothetical protein BWX60_00624 [Candidatus Marinimicrobia bacterium ADurb.Bin030]|nr:MAG: hypothetical protein BWX60_00624 [Candidatus Marinimicrobia bacterium ADurb.Bin030]
MQFFFEVNIGGSDESMYARFGGIFNSFPATINVNFVSARQTADNRTFYSLRYLFYGFEVAFGGNWKSGLDDIHAEIG